jgi:PhzF family phenazine biosynthesis protein
LVKGITLSRSITAYEVAAFTDNPSAGSPTGVVLEADDLSDEQMQFIIDQLGFSHTAFLTESTPGNSQVNIRFFTPGGEIKNCGHATIAAHYLRASQQSLDGDYTLKQRTQSGVQEIQIQRQDGRITIHLKQDEVRFSSVKNGTLDKLLSVLNVPQTALDARYPVVLASPGANRFLVALNDLTTLKQVTPDLVRLNDLCRQYQSIGCFLFTIHSSIPPVEATARMFAPAIGVDEDTINGNSSGCLGAYLLRLDTGGTFGSELNLSVHQGHTFNRPGTVLVNAWHVGDKIQTVVGGRAVLVAEKQIQL